LKKLIEGRLKENIRTFCKEEGVARSSVGVRLAGDGGLNDAIAGKPGSYRLFNGLRR
jgi:hypothetical protein